MTSETGFHNAGRNWSWSLTRVVARTALTVCCIVLLLFFIPALLCFCLFVCLFFNSFHCYIANIFTLLYTLLRTLLHNRNIITYYNDILT